MGAALFGQFCPKSEEVITMNEATLAITISSLGILAVFAGLLIWGILTRQFHDIEEPKYRMLDLSDDEQESERKNVNKGDDPNA
jgi:nitrogen fixation-related uncharacterized protein